MEYQEIDTGKLKSDQLIQIKRFHRSVESFFRGSNSCAYCGANATDNEHVIPYSFIAPIIKKRNRNRGFTIVRSCRNCNSLASSRVFNNFWDKKQFIADRIRIKYKKILEGKKWTVDELDELSGRLQLHVYASEFNKKLLKLRLENLEKPEIIGHND